MTNSTDYSLVLIEYLGYFNVRRNWYLLIHIYKQGRKKLHKRQKAGRKPLILFSEKKFEMIKIDIESIFCSTWTIHSTWALLCLSAHCFKMIKIQKNTIFHLIIIISLLFLKDNRSCLNTHSSLCKDALQFQNVLLN